MPGSEERADAFCDVERDFVLPKRNESVPGLFPRVYLLRFQKQVLPYGARLRGYRGQGECHRTAGTCPEAQAAEMHDRHGSMTDPYIPLEMELQHVRKALSLIDRYGFGFTVITKSDRILRDLDLLRKINEKTKCVVQMTLTTCDEELCRKSSRM